MEKDYKEIIKKIRKEAEGIDVPDALSPVEIKMKLDNQKSMKSKKIFGRKISRNLKSIFDVKNKIK